MKDMVFTYNIQDIVGGVLLLICLAVLGLVIAAVWLARLLDSLQAWWFRNWTTRRHKRYVARGGEYITGVAARRPAEDNGAGGTIQHAISMAAPAQHEDLQYACGSGIPPWSREQFLTAEQGFTTNKRSFVDRTEARRIAVRAHQMRWPHPQTVELFSENLWRKGRP